MKASRRSRLDRSRSRSGTRTSAPANTQTRRDDAVGVPSKCHIFGPDDSGELDFSRDSVARLLAGGKFFWLDLYRPEPADFEILTDVFMFHPLAV